MHAETSDIELIQLVLAGQTAMYSQLIDRYKKMVFTIVLRYVKSREDAEEVAQDVFVKAYRSLSDFKGMSKFSTWLYTIATTTSLSFLRTKKLEVHSLDNENLLAQVDALPDSSQVNLLEQKSRIALVKEAINLLSTDDAQVILLFYKAEQTIDEIAKLLGKEANAVKVQLHRARTRLKEKMQLHFALEIKDL